MFRAIISSVHYTTSCNTQSSAPEGGQNNCPKHAELTGIINKPLLLHLVSCLYYLYQWCTVKQISDNEIYLLINYIKTVLWIAAKRLSHIQDARCLQVKYFSLSSSELPPNIQVRPSTISYVKQFISYILSQTVIWLCNRVFSVIHTQNAVSIVRVSTRYVSILEAFLDTNHPTISLSLAPWISFLPEKPIGPQSKECPHFTEPKNNPPSQLPAIYMYPYAELH